MNISKNKLYKLLTFVVSQQKLRDYQDTGHFVETGSDKEIAMLMDELINLDKNWFTNDIVYGNLSIDDILKLFKESED